jgi:hypothetical protein
LAATIQTEPVLLIDVAVASTAGRSPARACAPAHRTDHEAGSFLSDASGLGEKLSRANDIG